MNSHNPEKMADGAAENAFAELQDVMAEQKTAGRAYDKLRALKPGDLDYDKIRDEHLCADDPHEVTREEIEHLVRVTRPHAFALGCASPSCACGPQADGWRRRLDELDKRESELYTILSETGHDILGFYNELNRRKVARVETDPAEIAFRRTVDTYLNRHFPVERFSATGNVSTIIPLGASGYEGVPDDGEELAHVDVLDDSVELQANDQVPDEANIFKDERDANEIDEPARVEKTGALWFEGFRLTSNVQACAKPHQLECITFLLGRLAKDKGALVAHSMGLGKTFSVLAAMQSYAAAAPGTKMLVLAPKSMVQPWADEVDKWESYITLDAHPVTSSREDELVRAVKLWNRHGGLLIMGHDHFRRCHASVSLDTESIVIVDEAHLLKSSSTQLYGIIKDLDSQKRILLTGTPLQNNLKEYYTMIELVEPSLLGNSVAEFNRLYGNVIEKGMTKDATDVQIAQSERLVHVLRWRVADVMHDKSAEWLRDSIPPKSEFRLLHGCDSYASDPSILNERHNVHDAARRHKLQLFTALVDSIRLFAPSDSIVVFSTRHDTLQQFQAARDGMMFTGSITIEQRDKILSDFRTHLASILYVATKAGGVGINLSKANRVVLADASWNPTDDIQAVSRCYRMGQEKPVVVYRLIAEASLEERIYRLGVNKYQLAARVLDDQDVNRVYSKEDLLTMTDGVEEQVPMTPVDVKDIVLQSVMQRAILNSSDIKSLVVTDHSKLFLDGSTKLSEEETARARNEFNKIIRKSPRTLTTADGTVQIIQPGQYKFNPPYENEFVPPYIPYFRSDDSTDDLNKTATETTVFDNGALPSIHLGPYVPKSVADAHTFKFQIFHKLKSADEDAWEQLLSAVQFVSAMGDEKKERRILPQMATGVYQFKTRLLQEGGACGPWSGVSAPITIKSAASK